jgi:hypothetical protein
MVIVLLNQTTIADIFQHLPRDMRPLFSMDSLMALGIDTRDVLPPLRSFFFFGFSTAA